MGLDETLAACRVPPTSEQKALERSFSTCRQELAEQSGQDTLNGLADIYSATFVEAVEYVRARLRAATIIDDPWPHMVLDDIYPSGFWRTLVRDIPPLSFFEDEKKKKDLDLTDTFGAFRLSPALARASWRFALDVLVSLVIVPELVSRWREGLSLKYDGLLGCDCSHFRYTTLNQRLMYRAPGYELKPHLDSSRLGLTCLTYLTGAEGEDRGLGTDLYVGDDIPMRLGMSTTYAHKNDVMVTPAGAVPFKPNRMLIFLNQPRAHHGASVPDDPKYAAGRIIWQYHISPFEEQIQATLQQRSAA